MIQRATKRADTPAAEQGAAPELPGQAVLVFQGGGALGAYQLGVYQAMHEAGIEPAWVIGTSIGAINGAIIAGNPPANRLRRLEAFWQLMARQRPALIGLPWLDWFARRDQLTRALNTSLGNLQTLIGGIPGFFSPNPYAALAPQSAVGLDRAAYYDTAPLRQTLAGLVDFDLLNQRQTRLTVGAVNVTSGAMQYFDNRRLTIGVEHVMASGALPPAFPAVRVDGGAYWDGGIFSNTPIEVVFDDRPRRDAVIFAVNMWHAHGDEPDSIARAIERQKDIQYASRADSHIYRQHQLHRLRHIIEELGKRLPEAERQNPEVREMLGYGCKTRMHVIRLLAPRLDGEDMNKDIDFSPRGIATRRQAGYDDTRRVIASAPWKIPLQEHEGVAIHDPPNE